MKKLLAVLLVAFIALGAVFADDQDPASIDNPTAIKLLYKVAKNDNAFSSVVRFKVNGNDADTYYEKESTVDVTGTTPADSGIAAGAAIINIWDASRNTTGILQKTYITLTPPANWMKDSLPYSSFTASNFAAAASSSDGATATAEDTTHKITITYPAEITIRRDLTPVHIYDWTLSWTADDSAPEGDYTATIGVSYTAI